MPVSKTKLGDYIIQILYDESYSYSCAGGVSFIAYNGKDKIRYCFQDTQGLSYFSDENEFMESIKSGFLFEW